MFDPALIAACTPATVDPATVREVIRVESGGDPLVLHVNVPGGDGVTYRPKTVVEAMGIILEQVAAGRTVDIGLMQINTRTAERRRYALPDMLDPCKNIRAGALELEANYSAALNVSAPGQPALQTALSLYNTGDFNRGFRNGYVARYYQPETVRSGGGGTRRAEWSESPYTADTMIYAGTGTGVSLPDDE